MNKKVTISLSALIVLLLVIIAAGVYELYRGIAFPDILHGKTVAEKAIVDTTNAVSDQSVPAENIEAAQEAAKNAKNEGEKSASAPAEKTEAKTAEKETAKKAAEKTEAASTKTTETKKAETKKAATVTKLSVTNCGTGKKNTLRQNKDNSIELINEKGKSLWKREMSGKWGGAVGEVDYFSNKKIQFLIVVGKQLYLIDRLGRDVKGFPKSIPFEGVNGPLPVKTDKGSFWKIETSGDPVFLNAKANDILTQLP